MLILVLWNLITFTLTGIDKYRAVKGKYRISERVLFSCAFFLGGPGILCGMYVFRHKTRHWSFRLLIPAAVAVNAVSIFFAYRAL